MKTTPIGIADIIEAADALQLRGAALEAMVAMFGFALPSGQAPGVKPPREPPPGEDEDDDDDARAAAVSTAVEALPTSVRRLEPVRQGTTPASTWVDPLSQSREARRLAADRERLRMASCRIEAYNQLSTGFLVSGNRLVSVVRIARGAESPQTTGRAHATFSGRPPSIATLQISSDGRRAADVLTLREPLPGIAPLTLGRAVIGPFDGFGYPSASGTDGLRIQGTITDVDGRDTTARPVLVLSATWPGDRLGLAGMPIVQGGRVVGILLPDGLTSGSGTALACRSEEIVRLLPGEVLHAPATVPAAPQPPAFESLFAPRDAVALLRLAASTPVPGDRLDVPRITDALARAQPLRTLPTLAAPSLAYGARVLVDVGQPMQPFWEDQRELVNRVRQLLRTLADIRYVDDVPDARMGRDRRRASWEAFTLPRPGTPVIALSDLGCGFPRRPESARGWLRLAARLRQRQCRLVAFAPVRLARVPAVLRRAVDVVVWDGAARRRNLSKLTRAVDG